MHSRCEDDGKDGQGEREDRTRRERERRDKESGTRSPYDHGGRGSETEPSGPFLIEYVPLGSLKCVDFKSYLCVTDTADTSDSRQCYCSSPCNKCEEYMNLTRNSR